MTTGVLLMAHGHRRARRRSRLLHTDPTRPSADAGQLAELEGRYAAIGGVSPLTVRTTAQVDAVRAVLDARAPAVRVAFGASTQIAH